MPNAALPPLPLDPRRIQEQMVEHSTTCMMLMDARHADMPIVYANRAFERLTGYTAAEMCGQSAYFLQVEANPSAERDRLQRELEANGEIIVVQRTRRKNDSIFWAEVRLSPIREEDGAITHFMTILTDVTHRQQNNANELKFHAFLDQSVDGLFLTDEQGAIIEWNLSMVRITGIPVAEAVGKMVWDVQFRVIPDERKSLTLRAHLEQITREALRTGKRQWSEIPIEVWIQRPDGSRRMMQSSSFLIETSQGNRIAAISRDITELKQNEEALRESQIRLARAQRIAHLGDWDFDVITSAVTWSDETYRLFGYRPHEVPVTLDLFLSAVHTDDRARVEQAIADSLERDLPYSLDHRIRLPDGRERIVHDDGEVVRDEAGKPIRMIGTILDITELKRKEEALRESQIRLARAQRIAHLGDWDFDVATGAITWSDETFRIFGYRPHEVSITYDLFLNASHPDDQTRLAQAVKDSL